MTGQASATNVNGTLLAILAKHGPWAFFACCFLGIVVCYQLRPAAIAQEALAADRLKLLNAITASLDTNAKSIGTITVALNALDKTIETMSIVVNSNAVDIRKAHDEEMESLDCIEAALKKGGT